MQETVTQRKPLVIERVSWIYIRDHKVLYGRSPDGDVFFDPGGRREPGKSDQQILIEKMRLDFEIELVPETIERMGSFSFAAQAYGKEEGDTVEIYPYTADFLGVIKETPQVKELAWFTSTDRRETSEAGKALLQRLATEGLID